MTIRVLYVWWDGRLVGQLTQNQHGELGFAYSPDWLQSVDAPPLSASLPKREKPFSRRECRPFFGGLLPEESQRDAAARALGVSRGNDFALLDRLGGDVAGALQLLPPGEMPTAPQHQQPTPLDYAGLIRVLDALPLRPLLAGEDGLRLSLAGAQSKVPVILVHGAVALPSAGQPTTHILKPPMSRFSATTENEAFVMRLASAVGLDVAPVETRIVRDRTFLLVQRYDRSRGEDGVVRRIHQEDFCQALGVPSETKYASEGGPSFKDGFELLRRVAARPAVDVLKLLDAAIFNLIVGNADAHARIFRSSMMAKARAWLPSTIFWPRSPILNSRRSSPCESVNARRSKRWMRRAGPSSRRTSAWACHSSDEEFPRSVEPSSPERMKWRTS